ncbi:MAG: hypothetical protein ABSF29_06930, partial [Tepidisphaeraceae bacterium]
MPVPSELHEFIDELSKSTQENKVKWTEPTRSGRFVAEIESVSVQIWKWSRTYLDGHDAERNEDVISVQLFDQNNREIISFDVGSLENEYETVENLHGSALMQARDVGALVNRLVARLKKGPPEPQTAANVFKGIWQLRYKSTSGTARGAELFLIANDNTYRTHTGATFNIAELRRDDAAGQVSFEKRGI